MNSTAGKLTLNMMTELCDGTVITILTAILSISCIMALLLIIPTTIQYIGTLISSKAKMLASNNDNNNLATHLNLYEINLYRYRLVFNLSVFLIIMGSSIPLLIHLINISHQNKGHLKVEETTYEFVVSLWGVCQLVTLIDIGSRIFFASMVTIPTVIICCFLVIKKTRPDLTFKLILILSFVALIFSYLSPVYLLANFWKKRHVVNDSYVYCASHKRNIFYIRIQFFEMFMCHLLPLLIIVPSILYTSLKIKFTSLDVFYEPIIFVAANTPFLIIEMVEQFVMSSGSHFNIGQRFAHFYMCMMTFYHLSYTCMFLVVPIRSMFQDSESSEREGLEINNVYQVLIKRATMRYNLKRQFSVLTNPTS